MVVLRSSTHGARKATVISPGNRMHRNSTGQRHGNYRTQKVVIRGRARNDVRVASDQSTSSSQIVEPTAKVEEAPFRFADLPPELRNRIYFCVFTTEGFIDTYSTPKNGKKSTQLKAKGKIKTQESSKERSMEGTWIIEKHASDGLYDTPNMLALLQTCRQIYQEAKTIPYYCNRLHFSSIRSLFDFITDVSYARASTVHDLAIELFIEDTKHDHKGTWQVLQLLPNLKTLQIIDVDFVTHDLLDVPGSKVHREIMRLRGLEEFEVTFVDARYRSFRNRVWNRERARRLEIEWEDAVTQPKVLI